MDDTRLELVTSRTSSGCATSCANRPLLNQRDVFYISERVLSSIFLLNYILLKYSLFETGTALSVRWRNITDFNRRMNQFKLIKNIVDIFFIIKDKIGEFFFIMDQYQPEIIVCRAVIRLAFTDTAESPFYILIGDTVFPAEIFIVQAKLS